MSAHNGSRNKGASGSRAKVSSFVFILLTALTACNATSGSRLGYVRVGGTPVWQADGYIYFAGTTSTDSGATFDLWRARPGEDVALVDVVDPECRRESELTSLSSFDADNFGL